MVPQERDLITTLLARLKSAGGQPKDPEADTLIRQAMVEQPDAPYYPVPPRPRPILAGGDKPAMKRG